MSKKHLLAVGSLAMVLAVAFGALLAPAALAQDESNPLASCDASVQALVWAARDAYGYNVNRMMTPATTSDMGDSDDATDDSDDAPEAEATEAAKLSNFAKVPTGVQQDATEEPGDDSSDDSADTEEMDDAGEAEAVAPVAAMVVDCNAIRADVIAFIYAANGMTQGGAVATAPTFQVDGVSYTAEYEVLMSGPQEVPGPGDADGQGRAWVSIDADTGLVCWSMQVSGIELPASAAHIHVGAEGESGPPVVPLTPPGLEGASAGCAEAEAEVIQSILDNPSGHYVNVHTGEHPDGAVRGQLLGVGL